MLLSLPALRRRVLQLTYAFLQCSGQLYAINMQYGVGGARTNAVANLLEFSSNSSAPPSATDFEVQLGNPAQTGNVSVLSTYSSSSDYLIRVRCLHNTGCRFAFMLQLAVYYWARTPCASTLCYSLKIRRSHPLPTCS